MSDFSVKRNKVGCGKIASVRFTFDPVIRTLFVMTSVAGGGSYDLLLLSFFFDGVVVIVSISSRVSSVFWLVRFGVGTS